jgi:pimeloyl-ACP methyl ester carboxylesterase
LELEHDTSGVAKGREEAAKAGATESGGLPAVAFIHGAGSGSDFWHFQRPAFPHAHYISLPGHSPLSVARGVREEVAQLLSIPPESLIEWYADRVEEYITGAGAGMEHSSVVLDGHSMGGAVALTLALRHPGWLKALVLTGTGARLPVAPRILELLRTDYAAAVDLIIEMSFAARPSQPLTYSQKIRRNGARRQMLRVPQEVTLADYRACERFDITSRVAAIGVPALIIAGSEDRMVSPAHSLYLHEQIRGSRLVMIEGAGHMLPLERPEEYNQRVAEFVAAI